MTFRPSSFSRPLRELVKDVRGGKSLCTGTGHLSDANYFLKREYCLGILLGWLPGEGGGNIVKLLARRVEVGQSLSIKIPFCCL
jgi:hypothetical protein